MMGSSQHAGWCKKPTQHTNAGTTLKVVRKTVYTIVLLAITAVIGATENSTWFLHCVISLASLLSLLLLLAVIHPYTICDSRTMRNQYKPGSLPSAELSGPSSISAPEQR
ncbi:hypothetical protein llap_12274 [Limosa lapponica baueri]|uniref:Uncharacterized protein n=1 Tax=Limosa lapponica baueri TaxID=1758121 RepID=A0A2I0TUF1_LIMLA|nr:hypothetical protein llap_12274 [Limosa lapponica baueri]